MAFTKQEQRFIDYLDNVEYAIKDLSMWEDNFEVYNRSQKEIIELKREFFKWFKKQIIKK